MDREVGGYHMRKGEDIREMLPVVKAFVRILGTCLCFDCFEAPVGNTKEECTCCL